ncbi:C6 finger domain [Mycena kentingensis (nom. inval.)]|nr:C6 finger domain [Mycena kentingensis (nom. inval.)]
MCAFGEEFCFISCAVGARYLTTQTRVGILLVQLPAMSSSPLDTMSSPPTLDVFDIFSTRRRVIIACTNCRKRKVRCLTAEDSPVHPCTRCVAKGLRCEYITVTDQREDRKRRVQQRRQRARSRGMASNSSGAATPSPLAPYPVRPWSAQDWHYLDPSEPVPSPYHQPTGLPAPMSLDIPPHSHLPVSEHTLYSGSGYYTPPGTSTQTPYALPSDPVEPLAYSWPPVEDGSRRSTQQRRNTAPPFSSYDGYMSILPTPGPTPAPEFLAASPQRYPGDLSHTDTEAGYTSGMGAYAYASFARTYAESDMRYRPSDLRAACGICPLGACTCVWERY